eukprot:Nk52_evm17s564 gene=Nk52_evmTU17s564
MSSTCTPNNNTSTTAYKTCFQWTSQEEEGPRVQSVLLAGEFTAWQPSIPLRVNKQAGNVWEANVTLPAGRHSFKFVVEVEGAADKEWRVSDRYGTVQDGAGNVNNVVEVQEETARAVEVSDVDVKECDSAEGLPETIAAAAQCCYAEEEISRTSTAVEEVKEKVEGVKEEVIKAADEIVANINASTAPAVSAEEKKKMPVDEKVAEKCACTIL